MIDSLKNINECIEDWDVNSIVDSNNSIFELYVSIEREDELFEVKKKYDNDYYTVVYKLRETVGCEEIGFGDCFITVTREEISENNKVINNLKNNVMKSLIDIEVIYD